MKNMIKYCTTLSALLVIGGAVASTTLTPTQQDNAIYTSKLNALKANQAQNETNIATLQSLYTKIASNSETWLHCSENCVRCGVIGNNSVSPTDLAALEYNQTCITFWLDCMTTCTKG